MSPLAIKHDSGRLEPHFLATDAGCQGGSARDRAQPDTLDRMEHASKLEMIRLTTKSVVKHAKWVRLNNDRLVDYARSLPLDRLVAPALDPASHFIGSPRDTLAFFVTLDTINFGSGYFPHLRKRPGMSGYFTVATCLTEHFRLQGAMSATQLEALDAGACRTIFHQSRDDGPVDELMSLFARALNELGRLLLSEFAGDFEALVESANGSAEKLVGVLSRMSMFRDVQSYRGSDVAFYKRAQLTAADLNLALNGTGLGKFNDLHRLTIFADNLVPHVLRCDGVLEYDPTLAGQIDRGEPIPAGSEQEIEIRASAVHACECIVQELNTADRRTGTSAQLDYLLWNRGQQPDYKARPRHRARTFFY